MNAKDEAGLPNGGLARFFVEHREVGWAAAVAVLIWGWTAYTQLAQQEDPKIPERRATVVTPFPGASAAKVEELVTQKLERKIAELPAVEEVKSQSRAGVSVITVTLQPARQARVEQEWDKLRAKLAEVRLPAGSSAPVLNTDFGNTLTLLFGIVSPSVGAAENEARARLIQEELAGLRAGTGSSGRAAVVAFYPPSIAPSYRDTIQQKFENAIRAEGLATDVRTRQRRSFTLADLRTPASRETLQAFIDRFARDIGGTDSDLHPDFGPPLVLMGDEDPRPQLQATAMPRHSYRELEIMAEQLEDDLKQLAGVGKVTQIGTVQEAVYLLLTTASVSGQPVTPEQVMDAIAARNAVVPGGVFRAGGQDFAVQVTGEFLRDGDLENTVVGTTQPAGAGGRLEPIYLRDLFEVRRMYEEPIPFKVDMLVRDGAGPLVKQRAVLLGVEMKEGQIIHQFDAAVRRAVQDFQARLPEGVRLVTVSDQPAAVAGRIQQFIRCFVEAVIIVILVAMLFMDGRSALVVAAAIPLTVALTLGAMALLGLPLHQISIAALIIALGMLVDDPVVASDAINRELHQGRPRVLAAWLGPVKLAHVIFYATAINIVAFLPLLLLPGDKGAFIGALPVVVTLALVASRFVSMTFVPLIGYYLLRGQAGMEESGAARSFFLFRWVDRGMARVLPAYRRLLVRALDHPGRSVAVAYGLLLVSFALMPLFGRQFFPPAERNQLLVDIELPATTSIVQTRQTAAEVESILRQRPEIVSAAVFTGGSAPRFYYNVQIKEPAHHLAQVLINTRSARDVPPLLVALRRELDARIAGARCVVRQLEQGPPVEVPIQIRVSGEDLDTLRRLGDGVSDALRAAGGYRVHDDLGILMPGLEIQVDQDRASTLGISNVQIGRLAQAAFAGLKVTELREGDHLIPVLIRLRIEERNEADKIRALYVQSATGQLVPVESFARVGIKPEYATLPHFGLLRTVTVKSFSEFGELPSTVLRRALPAIRRLTLPPGYRLEIAGEDKELRQSQAEMGTVMKVSLALIGFALVLQFRSVTQPMVVLLAVPLGLVGAFIGIALLGTSLGFMALLGVVSLAGIIVSHIIVLADFIEEARAGGMELKAALVQAGLVRLRAVMVTVLAVVGGLIPLALTGGELWRPLTAVHIFGLLGATLLTLVILPVLYYLFCARLKLIR